MHCCFELLLLLAVVAAVPAGLGLCMYVRVRFSPARVCVRARGSGGGVRGEMEIVAFRLHNKLNE